VALASFIAYSVERSKDSEQAKGWRALRCRLDQRVAHVLSPGEVFELLAANHDLILVLHRVAPADQVAVHLHTVARAQVLDADRVPLDGQLSVLPRDQRVVER
jgi:hypothetical protein